MRPRPRTTLALGAVVGVLAVLSGLFGATAVADQPGVTSRASVPVHTDVSETGDTPGLPQQPGDVWFGPELDWDEDSPDGYADRLGREPATYATRLPYPATEESQIAWQQAASDVAAQGSALILSLEPTMELDELTADHARAFVEQLDDLHDQYGTHQLVRFAPEMNGSWTAWGQQPSAYVEAFQVLAAEVHAGTAGAEMVWAPSYGSGYPFARADGRLEDLQSSDLELLDTNGDDELTESDDPYGPFYPGAEAVDRVGMTMFYFGKGEAEAAAGIDVPLESNELPTDDHVVETLEERWGYTTEQPESFYSRFASSNDHPMVLDTGALYDDSLDGASELEVKQSWWNQVFAALDDYPNISAITWLEAVRDEAEADGREVSWMATSPAGIAETLHNDLERTEAITSAPITQVITREDASESTVQVRETAETGDELDWIIATVIALAVAYLLSGIIGRLWPRWRYPEDAFGNRDLRIDFLRGFLIIVVVTTHIELSGPYSFAVLKIVGAITGAEMFVMLSGIVLGLVFAPTVKRLGEWRAARAAFRRAGKQYVVALAVILIIFALSFVPFINTTDITTFTDRGTGSNGQGAEGRVYDLYPNADRLLDYPPPWYAVRQFLLLEMGPWPFNIMGLFVILSLIYPILMWFIRRKMWWLVLAASWAVYAANLVFPEFQPLPSQFNAVFPLFAWQVLFTHGLVLGYYRRPIIRALTSRLGKILVGVFVVGYAAFLGYVWASDHYGFQPVPFAANLYDVLYESGYRRIDLNWGRLIDVPLVLVTTYAVLTVAWKPINALMGWLWVPLGQASMYVFVVHVFFALAVANIPGLDRTSYWQGFLIHSLIIGIIWFMVRQKFLFRVIPR